MSKKIPHDAGIKHGEHGDGFGSSKAKENLPYPKIPGMNAPLPGHAGSHDGVTRESGGDAKK